MNYPGIEYRCEICGDWFPVEAMSTRETCPACPCKCGHSKDVHDEDGKCLVRFPSRTGAFPCNCPATKESLK